MGAIYELRRFNDYGWHDVRADFNENRFRYSKVVKGDTHTHRQQSDLISLHLFSKQGKWG
jgi:hypothetical protein